MDIQTAIKLAGGPKVVADRCGVSRTSVHQWVTKGRFPASDYTAETQYAQIIADMICNKGIQSIQVRPLDICPGAGQYMAQQQAA